MDLVSPFSGFSQDLLATLPLLIIGLGSLVIVAWDAFKPNATGIPVFTALLLAAALGLELVKLGDPAGTAYFGMIRTGGFAAYLSAIIFLSGLLSVIVVGPYLKAVKFHIGEVYALMLMAIAGAQVFGTANNMVALFVGLETMSICLYILTALVRTEVGSLESALKYFLLGAFSTGFLLYGIALLYGASGTMVLPDLLDAFQAREGSPVMFWAGFSLFLVGFLFKISAAPFHMWTPDAYQGAPTPLTGFMATASKAAAFGALILVLYYTAGQPQWQHGIAVVAAITMILGNLLALVQKNIKRMLAYSSIAHAGYVLTGLAAASPEGFGGALYYMLVYAIMNVGAFAVIAYLEWDGKLGSEQTLDSIAGVGLRRPLLGVTMTFFMFSLTGFPPLAGFLGKVAVFAPAVHAGLVWLVVLGVLSSAVSAGYYLRVIYVFWMKKNDEAEARTFAPVPAGVSAVLVACAALVLILFFFPSVLDLATSYFVQSAPVAMLP